MARKRNNSSSEGINLDSLMDALTNVVAVLILVLILVQADVTQKVQKILDDLAPATPAEVVASQNTVADLKKQQDLLAQRLLEKAPTPEVIEAEKRQLALLQKDIETNKDLLVEIDELKKVEIQFREQQNTESQKTAKIQADIANLEAQLDASPVKMTVPTVVNIPNSRDIPKNATIYQAIALQDRIHFIDTVTPIEMFEEELKKHKNDWIKQRVKQKGADRYIYDQDKIAAFFKEYDFQNSRQQSVTVQTSPTYTGVNIRVAPNLKEGGTSLAELADKNCQFANILRKLSSDRNAVLMFYVAPDSFNTYLAARELADKAGVPAGWEIRSNGDYAQRIPDVEVNRTQEPPPPPPNQKPAPPGPPSIKPKLD